MKKIIFLICFFPISVYASNILDNYHIDINIDGYQVHVKETFDVIETDQAFFKAIIYNQEYIDSINSNIDSYTITNEDYYYLKGSITSGKSYYLEYETNHYILGTNAYQYHNPIDTIINNLSFKISYLNSETWVLATNYTVSEDSNTIIGYLNNKENNYFFVNSSVAHIKANNNNNHNSSSNSKTILIINLATFALLGLIIIFKILIKQKK